MTAAVEKTRRRLIEGKVLSNKMQKTVVVEVTSMVRHPKYGKYFKRYKKFKAHDESNDCKVGDRVQLIESRPISKEKRFRVQKVVERAKSAGIELVDEQV